MKSEDEATQVRGWYGVGTELVRPTIPIVPVVTVCAQTSAILSRAHFREAARCRGGRALVGRSAQYAPENSDEES